MRKEIPKLEIPLNADERLLYAIAVRLDRVIELLEKKEIIESEAIVTSRTIEEVAEYSVDNMTKKEIIAILDEKNIEYDNKATKSTLIKLLK